MTKVKKIWLGTLMLIFIVPEILWSPAINFWYAWYKPTVSGYYQIWRNNFLHKPGNAGIWSNLMLLEFFGIFLTAVYLISIRESIKNKLIRWVLISISLLVSLYVLNLYRLSSIKITF